MTALPVPSRLFELEDVIERGLATFVEVGQALIEIQTDRLYRETHDTFEFYCRDRWGFSRQTGYDLMQTARVVELVQEVGQDAPAPTRETARKLAPLRQEPEALREAWTTAVDKHGPTPTAAQVREVVDDACGRTLAEPEPAKFDTEFKATVELGDFRQTMTRGQLSNQSGGTDEWATPQDFYDVVNAEFGFDLDVCALDSSAKCARYFTPDTDGLAHEWTGTVWMNPPYGDVIATWMAKAFESAKAGATVVCLVPARTDTGWFHDYAFPGQVRFIKGRLRFGEAEASAPFPSCLVVLGPNVEKAAFDWSWR